MRRGVSGFERVILWMTLATIAGVMLFYGGNRPAPLTVLFALSLTLATLHWFSHLRAHREAHAGALLLPGALYGGVLSWAAYQASTGLSLDADATWSAIAALSAYAACFWIAAQVGRSRTTARRVVDAVALFGAALSVYGIAAHLTGVNPILGDDPTVNRERLTATFANPNSFAFVAATAALASLSAIDRRLSEELGDFARVKDVLRAIQSRSWLFALAFLACLIALFLTASRGGVIVAALAVFVWLALRRGAGQQGRSGSVGRVAALLGALIFAIGLFVGSDQILDRLSETDQFDAGRSEIFATTWIAIADHTETGVGLGAYEEGVKPYLRDGLATQTWAKAHNLYLELMLELGLPAFLAWATALGLISVRIGIGALRRQGTRDVTVFAASLLALATTHSLIDFPLQMPATACLFAVILGLGWAQSWPRRRHEHRVRSI